MPAASPASVCVLPGASLSTTRVPELAVAGGVPPTARRIITPAKSASPGLLQDSDTLLPVVPVTDTPVTGPGAVVSGGLVVEAVSWRQLRGSGPRRRE